MKGKSGGFTLPGEAGYERLTMELAGKWGADCIRDSDGTMLSDEIMSSGIPIYSTVCLVRSINSWARQNMDKLQRNFLITKPSPALGDSLEIRPLDGFFSEQFTINPKDDPGEFWEVRDRTAGVLLPPEDWSFSPETGVAAIKRAKFGHLYTVSFLATRLWEEISMYNHLTNNWGDKERLMAVEPRYPEARQALLDYLEKWCVDHPQTSVVRFTSMFYNFCWIWGSEPARPHLYSDWAGYDFTVNPVSLRAFEQETGYRMTADDFVAGGLYRPAHNPPTSRQLAWMEFTVRFVRSFAKECVDLVHRHGKKAYVFYDDTWIGLEPWSGHFAEIGFDGIIKCVFNAFEARLCAGVDTKVHELRLHPYLFPVGLKGEPTFSPGGKPEEDARRYWACVRRALLRAKIDRIGLGGYLHLVEPFPAFVQEVARIAEEFRTVKALHESGNPWQTGIRVGILHSWGSLRTWTCSGHLHEHPELPLTHIWEALAGQPFDVKALSFTEVESGGVPDDLDVLINAGSEGDAWSGGEAWGSAALREKINAFILRGGGILGVKEPSALRGEPRHFVLADALGVDREVGQTICHNKYRLLEKEHFITHGLAEVPAFSNRTKGVYPLGPDTQVLNEKDGSVSLAARHFGGGRCVYLDGFTYSPPAARLLYRALLWLAGKEQLADILLPEDPALECAWFPDSGSLLVFNSEGRPAESDITFPGGRIHAALPPHGTFFRNAIRENL